FRGHGVGLNLVCVVCRFGVHGVEKDKQEGNQQKYGKKNGQRKGTRRCC
ncbi:hypothetical protein A2U01_0070941, partial [Trifolium medium]|nr:hypothetical protein [Trifolium medium]